MIGLEIFRSYFADHAGSYALIGGAACTLLMEEAGLTFRATKDLDIVLHIEALESHFFYAVILIIAGSPRHMQ